ncbi:MAG: aspartate carbamoyltransferase [Ignavibacteriales bacterium]|nr:aspartate carbamoyltransferase [Ignavibacteriales bacterium]
MKLGHVIESQQFTLPMLVELFEVADQMERIVARGGTQDYQSKIMASLFYEHSTRTRFSFESAMYRLGGKVLSTERANTFSSVAAGETLEDTIRVVSNYADVIVLRHNEIGGCARAAAISAVPIVNAGDGKGGQHPTQALLDLYTIYKGVKTLEGVKVALVGNLTDGRTVRSLAYLLGKFERVKLYFVAPDSFQIKQDILDYLTKHNVWYALENNLKKILPEVDVVYSTRIEPELLTQRGERLETISQYFIDDTLLKLLPSHALVMHPLPRLHEISPTVDTDPRAVYFKQTKNGVLIRMALLASVLGY